MSHAELPVLSGDTRLEVVREGGFAYLPGLAAPREIDCDRLTPLQWVRLDAGLQALAGLPEAARTPPDGRFFRLTLSSRRTGQPHWQRCFDEPHAPAWLIRLWQDGHAALDEEAPLS
ncbi:MULTISPECIES: protealysin inhibitor emfourin [unclassified Chromohalobacter]|uniref:protealysin inhibitor emfourin n=1 Tax=unclassified Chromohalobacter TaxID=2628571 RepID=UPI002468890D|nr:MULTISPECIES: protealysin inhibitor emfourin [unclassified Chromohalobacter]